MADSAALAPRPGPGIERQESLHGASICLYVGRQGPGADPDPHRTSQLGRARPAETVRFGVLDLSVDSRAEQLDDLRYQGIGDRDPIEDNGPDQGRDGDIPVSGICGEGFSRGNARDFYLVFGLEPSDDDNRRVLAVPAYLNS